TFKQVSEMEDCKIRAGEKATAVEYWLVWDTKNRRSMTFSQYAQLRKDDPSRKEDEFRIYPKTAYVFNAAQVEGLQPLPQVERTPLEEDRLAEEVISTMSENMGVPLIYGGDEAYYIPGKDEIHLPQKDSFRSASDYYGTALHELAHSTSAPSRLDRSITGFHEDPDAYSREEIRAEVASAYACAALNLEMPDSVIENVLRLHLVIAFRTKDNGAESISLRRYHVDYKNRKEGGIIHRTAATARCMRGQRRTG
ncbi:MAG: hypothetical protein J6V25_10085, partial [Oscillospiraceae bacterium]|nr:hypothetical protein [Oscillospiraceae bacterium]